MIPPRKIIWQCRATERTNKKEKKDPRRLDTLATPIFSSRLFFASYVGSFLSIECCCYASFMCEGGPTIFFLLLLLSSLSLPLSVTFFLFIEKDETSGSSRSSSAWLSGGNFPFLRLCHERGTRDRSRKIQRQGASVHPPMKTIERESF